MPIGVVPVIYDHASKRVLRWFLLDFDRQLNDQAFKPQNQNERILRISIETYQAFGRTNEGLPALTDIQNYVKSTAP